MKFLNHENLELYGMTAWSNNCCIEKYIGFWGGEGKMRDTNMLAIHMRDTLYSHRAPAILYCTALYKVTTESQIPSV